MAENRLQELVGSRPQASIIGDYLDSIEPERRRREALSLALRAQWRLFNAVQGYRPLDLDDMVPATLPPLAEIVHWGRNTLPLASAFAKVMCRPPASPDELWGYNRAGPLIETAVGPGYFVLRRHRVQGELLVDYHRLPAGRAPHWPPIISNRARLSRFVYHGTQDVLRRVSEHVTIGRAARGSRELPSFFVLCRDDTTA